jgi:hypothetical protein
MICQKSRFGQALVLRNRSGRDPQPQVIALIQVLGRSRSHLLLY